MMERNDFTCGELMNYLDAFLRAHPDVLEDRMRAWDSQWNPERPGRDGLGDEVEDVLAEEMRP